MSRLNEVKKHLRPGHVYRRADLEQWSATVDRHLMDLQAEGVLTKLYGGIYYYPKKTAFGEAPPDDRSLVQAFLKDNRFLLTSPNAYNTLGVGTTQLYNETVVYNHKRHGHFELGGREFNFRMKPHFPKSLSKEFLLVDLVNNLDSLAEDRDEVLARIRGAASTVDARVLSRAVRDYGGAQARKFFAAALADDSPAHAIR